MGKANMYELGSGWGTFGHFPLAQNPWSFAHSPGGSSSGSAVGVATGLGFASLASDGGGSIRVPANYCGVVGLKPTHGRVSLFGSIPGALNAPQKEVMAKTISVAGVITRRVEDAAIMLQAISGWDARDVGTKNIAVPNFATAMVGNVQNVAIGVPWSYIEQEVAPDNAAAFNLALDVLADAGAKIVTIEPPASLEQIGWMWTTIAYVEMATFYGERFALSPEDFGPELKERIQAGLRTSTTAYSLATQARAQLRAEWLQLFKTCDVIATPTAPAAPPTMLELKERRSDLQNIGELARYTRPYNMTGLPAITVPDGFTAEGLPLGLQIGGRPFEESAILQVADAFERHTSWHECRPTVESSRD
jgi:aspartyl-tRNA(Asn)/glutamyl-tRNA(Gln) amidotransferase subunit A